jgi:2-phosphoglycolate phosphatase
MLDPSIKAVLFDFDGTFGDTAPDLIHSANFIFNQHNKEILSFAEGRQIASDGIEAFLDKRFDSSIDDYEQLTKEFLNYYYNHLQDNFKLFDGVDSLIDSLDKNNIAWGIVTNKSRMLTDKLLNLYHLNNRCHVVVCGDDGFKPKPEPDTLLFAIKSLNVAKEQTIYIGDGLRDIIAAKKANIKSILVTYGYLKVDDQYSDWGADYVIEHPSQITTEA